MDSLTFISNTIGQVLSWPVAVIVMTILFRKPIAERLKDVRKIKTKHFEADFGDQLKKVESDLKEIEGEIISSSKSIPVEEKELPKTHKELLEHLTEIMSNAAILESWRNVERTLDFYFTSRGIERPKSGQSILGHLDYDHNFPPQLVSAYQESRVLRNRAAHSTEAITDDQAKEFISLADKLTYALVNAADGSRG